MSWESRLHTAARRGDFQVVLSLLTDKNVNSKNDYGYTPLNCASYGGHTEIISLLLDHGADVNIDNGKGWTPLHAACREGQVAAVEMLLDNGAENCLFVTSKSYTPLLVACRSTTNFTGDIVRLLLKAGADVNSRDSQNRTPLMEASAKGSDEKVRILLAGGADVSAVDDNGLSALHMAVPYHRIVTRLIDAGANVNLKDYRNEIPLQRKSISKHSFMLFLEWGAGDDIPCTKHKRCKCSVLQCSYKAAYNSAKRGRFNAWNCFEKYSTALKTAGLIPENLFCIKRPSHPDYFDTNPGEFQERLQAECEFEFGLLKTSKIPGTNSTYLDALCQRPYTLRNVKGPALEHCRELFKTYGEMMWSRFLIGQRKLTLIDECVDFFSLTELPRLPSECVAAILSYLPEHDLKHLVSIYNLSARTSMELESNKRPNSDASLQVMKFLRVG